MSEMSTYSSSRLLDNLNPKQAQAVSSNSRHQLILAGAGSGKTRVLVHRLVWLMQQGIAPQQLMAVTFTNKASKEMKERIHQLNSAAAQGMWCGTFHGLCHRLLRTHYQAARLPQDFTIIDSDDQQRMLKRIITQHGLDEKQWPARQAAWWINTQKDEGLRVKHIDALGPIEKTYLSIYQEYENTCQRSGVVDFAEILLRSCELLSDNDAIRYHYQQRFAYVLVDEFQDTNHIQYQWLKLMTNPESTHVMVVGDDDQSIYGWRGAKVENIQQFLRDYDPVETIVLEQNYRSTPAILNAANQLIRNNQERMGKDLWTEAELGEPISIYEAFNEQDEAHFVQSRIQDWRAGHNALRQVAILYRSNAQSRVLEDHLVKAGIPYRIYGGTRFFDRLEIKDAIAYLRLIQNEGDDASFERVVNRPTRGLGDKTITILRDIARQRQLTLWEASLVAIGEALITPRARIALNGLIELIKSLQQGNTPDMQLDRFMERVLKDTGLLEMYENEKSEQTETRVENLQELIGAMQTIVENPTEELERITLWNEGNGEMGVMESGPGMGGVLEQAAAANDTPLKTFLSQVSLDSGDSQASEHEDAVQMMTMHSAKGLEFPLVFVVGMEENLFPNSRSIEEGTLEEERRLCYVAMTRAMSKLYFTYAACRRLYGQEKYSSKSRFIDELPSEQIDVIRKTTSTSFGGFDQRSNSGRTTSGRSAPETKGKSQSQSSWGNTSSKYAHGFSPGQKVKHASFGKGTIINIDGESRVQVAFDQGGIKWLMLEYANLSAV